MTHVNIYPSGSKCMHEPKTAMRILRLLADAGVFACVNLCLPDSSPFSMTCRSSIDLTPSCPVVSSEGHRRLLSGTGLLA